MVRKSWLVALWIGAVLLYVFLGAANLYWGDLNQDEGWYLYAARLVHQGQLPFKDFAFTQGPVLPIVYSAIQPWVDEVGVAGGRLFTAILGLVGALIAARLAARIAPPDWKGVASLLSFILISGNVYQSYFTTVVKTYSLCSLLLVAGMLALTYAREGGWLRCFFSGFLLALAAGTRSSAGVALPIAGLFLLGKRRSFGDLCWILFGIGGILGLCAVSVPFLRADPESFWFGVYGYHAARSAGGVIPALVYKAGFVSRFVQAFFFPIILWLAVVLLWFLKLAPASSDETGRSGAVLWAVGLGITLVHMAAPFPYEDYQVFVFPVLAAALASALVRLIPLHVPSSLKSPAALGLLLLAFLGSVAASFSSPVNQSWVISGRDRIWWKVKQQPAMWQLGQTAAWIRDISGGGNMLLTQDTYLAVETGMAVPKGLEMGPFSYFPDWDRAKAERYHVLNREMMKEVLDTAEAPIAAFSGYGLAIRAPEVTPLTAEEQDALWKSVKVRYDEVLSLPNFGQANTTLRVFKRRTVPLSSAP